MSPSNGILPRRIIDSDPEQWTLFDLAPESEEFLWALHWLGLLQAILLMLGIAPRIQLIGLFVHMVSFQHHNDLIWDAEDGMFRIWCFLLLFFPLHRCTIYDWIVTRNWDKDSWPMWPIRIFQLEVTFVYMGASFAKLPGGAWIDGTALYYIAYGNDFYPGIWNPEVIFNRLGGLKIMCWGGIITELTSWIMVWIPVTRTAAVINMVVFHLGIEITMNMHCFEWLAMLGWIVFLLQPPKVAVNEKSSPSKSSILSRISLIRIVTDGFILAITTAFCLDTLPIWHIQDQAPALLKPQLQHLDELRGEIMREYHVSTALNLAGIYQGVWDMYDGQPEADNRSYDAVITFEDGTHTIWKSKNFYEVGNWERKRYTRPLNYYSSLPYTERPVWSSLCVYLAKQYSEEQDKEVDFCELIHHREDAVPPPPDIGWWEPVKQPMKKRRPKSLVIIRRGCLDYNHLCGQLANDGVCYDDPMWMERNCQMSCNLCFGGEDDDDASTSYHNYWPPPPPPQHTQGGNYGGERRKVFPNTRQRQNYNEGYDDEFQQQQQNYHHGFHKGEQLVEEL